MAHADYDCCVICDSKMDYNASDPRTKEDVCDCCIEDMMQHGPVMDSPTEIIGHLKTLTDDAALIWLHAVGFSPCYYENAMDQYLIERGLVVTDGPSGSKWDKALKPLSASNDQ